MAEAQPPQGGQVGKPEGKSPQGLEILDAEKLGKYGALYGRFLLASQAQPEEVANILDPGKPVEFNLTTDVPLKKRDYNPISANLSFQERQEQWKDVPSFDAAYSEWRTKFTGFMKQITTDSKREMVLRMIMHDLKKAAADFKESDADKLFKEFCNGKSDVTAFIDRVTRSLVNPDGDRKIDPMTIQNVLPHIEWIASGLFGKKTATTVVTRLIELESALHNNPEQVVGIFNADKQRVKNPTDDEWGILGSLHSLIPQTKAPTPKPAAPVVTVTEPMPTTVSVSEPAPIIAKPEEDKAKDFLKGIRGIRTEGDELPPAAPIPPAESAIERAKKTLESLEEEQKRLSELLKRQLPTGAEPEAPHQPVIEEVVIEGSDRIRLKVNGKDLGFEFYKAKANGEYFLSLERGQTECLDIPEDIIVRFETRGSDDDLITIIGGKGTRLNIKDLNSLGIVFGNLKLLTPEDDDWKILMREQPEHKGQAWVVNDIYNLGKSVARWMSMEGLENYLKTRKEEIEKNKIAGEKAVGENIINVEHIKINNLPEELNKLLSQNKDRSHIVFSFSPKQFKEYIAFISKGVHLEGGDIKVSDDGNEVTMKGLRITKAGIGITLGLAIKNDVINGLTGITASIIEFQRDFLARANRASSREDVEKQIGQLEDLVMDGLYEQFSGNNSAWKIGNISISNGKFLARFEKTPQTV